MGATRKQPILVTGATGYVGGRLVPYLLEEGFRVRAMGRTMSKLRGRPWSNHPRVELSEGDVFDPISLEAAARGCHTAYYLVHSMNPGSRHFASADRTAARNMARAAEAAGLFRMIYLGGLGETNRQDLSRHLRSRHEVARILQSGSVPTTVLRAAMILGSGSASFEIMRYLIERLPVMITPRWVSVKNQPIAIRDVLGYLKGCLENDTTIGQTYDIGGPDILTYHQLFDIYTEEAGISKRLILPIPFFTTRISSYWIHIVTPVPASIARPLAEGLRNEVICREETIRQLIPRELLSCRETIRLALMRERAQRVDTCWSDAGCLPPPEWVQCGDSAYSGGTVLECGYRIRVAAAAADLWEPIVRIGGRTGWYYGNTLWRLRGLLDKLFGGIGLDRGRRSPGKLQVGDALDFWRVLNLERPHLMRLQAEMKVPGEAILEFHLYDRENGRVDLELRARFRPGGLPGLAYWFAMVPFHEWIFGGMLRSVAAASGKRILEGPARFTARLPRECRLS